VYREQVVLYVDCEQAATDRLELRGPIDVNGNITISKLTASRATVPVCNNTNFMFYIGIGGAEATSCCLLQV
jgi:collagen type IX alpha